MARKVKAEVRTGTRKSTRVKVKQNSELEKTPSTQRSGATSNPEVARTSGTKRKAKDSNDSRPRKRASKKDPTLSKIVEMPLDILHEIFGYLEPYDLLRLAGATKSIRNVLMHSSSKDIWKSSIVAMENLPSCPEDMTEPQYANLMFSYHCHACGLEPDRDGPVLYMIMEARTQLCKRCCRKQFKRWHKLPEKIPNILGQFVPATTADFRTENEKANDDEDEVVTFYVEAALALHKEYTALGDDENAKELWIKNQEEKWSKIKDHAQLCDRYMNQRLEQEEQRIRNEKEIKPNRMLEIRNRLEKLGWQGEIDYLQRMYDRALPLALRFNYRNPITRLQDHKLVDQDRKLTEQEWEQIRPKLIEWLEPTRVKVMHERNAVTIKERITKWILPIYLSFRLDLPANLPCPSLLEVCLMEEFRVPLEDKVDQSPSKEMFEAGSEALPLFVERWRTDREEELLSLVRRSDAYSGVDSESITRDTLQLATTVFLCSRCLKGMHASVVLIHACVNCRLQQPDDPRRIPSFNKDRTFTKTSSQFESKGGSKGKGSKGKAIGDSTTEILPGSLVSTALEGKYALNFSWGPITFFDAAFHHLRALLDVHNLPHTTTEQELKEFDLYAQCKCPCFGGRSDLDLKNIHWSHIMSPRFCLSHRKGRGYSHFFSVLGQDDIEELRRQRQATSNGPEYAPQYRCFVCGEGKSSWKNPQTKQDTINHLVTRHGAELGPAEKYIDEMLLDKDEPLLLAKHPDWMVNILGGVRFSEQLPPLST